MTLAHVNRRRETERARVMADHEAESKKNATPVDVLEKHDATPVDTKPAPEVA